MKFRLLGPLEVWSGDGWSSIGAGKWRSLLACLLLQPGQIVPTERLIDELWDDNPPPTATNLVSVYVLRLRRAIGDAEGRVLVHRGPGYQLKIVDGDTDLHRFESLVASGRDILAAGDAESAAALLAEAEALWRGAFLADVPPSAFVSAAAERTLEFRLAATELRLGAELACGRNAEAVPELRSLVAEHPLREGLWLLLMRALDGAGRHAEALDAYGQAREVIADELGVDPGTELQHLYGKLLSADASAAKSSRSAGPAPEAPVPGAAGQGMVTGEGAGWEVADDAEVVLPDGVPGTITIGAFGGEPGADASGVPEAGSGLPGAPLPQLAQLPADIGDFTGRGRQVGLLCGMLTQQDETEGSGAVRIVVVAGAAGLGKTALAVHTAHQVRSLFPDGQLYVDLSGASPDPAAPDGVLARFLRDLGVEGEKVPASGGERAALYRTRLTGRRVLILLDNAKDAAQVRSLLPGTASCAVLVTTRNRTPDLAGMRFVDLNVLSDTESLELFTRIVDDGRPAAEPDATAEILLACAGSPLAIRICAARLAARRQWRVATMGNRLRDERRRLDELRTGDLEVRASVQVSYDSLRAVRRRVDPARVFCMLGLWQSRDISLEDATVLIGERESDVADALETLVDANLLESPDADWYRLHDLLRVFASERAAAEVSPQEWAAAASRLRNRYGCDQPGEACGPANDLAIPVSDGVPRAACSPGSRLPIPQEHPGIAAGSGKGGSGAAASHPEEYAAEKTAAGTGAVTRATGDNLTEDPGLQTAGEPLQAVLHAILTTQGITGRDQAAAFFEALIRSWPGASGPPPRVAGESRGQAVPPSVSVIPDVPGYELRPDPLIAEKPEQFVEALAGLRQWAGDPSFREMAELCGHQASSAAICTALGRDKDQLPSLRIALAIVTACGGDEELRSAFTTAWRKLEMRQEPRRRRGGKSAKRKLYSVPDTAC